MIVSTFDTFDIIIVSNNYSELGGAIFLLLPLLILNKPVWVTRPIRTWPHFVTTIIPTITQRKGRYVAGFAGLVITFWGLILPLNIIGLLPYTFPVSSHISMTLSCRVGIWGGLVLIGLVTNYNKGVAILLPRGVGILSPFIILVELVRSIVRPLTLAFRLAANITAGHVILGLASSIVSYLILQGHIWAILGPTFYTCFELLICWAQAYVFVLLCVFYSNDYVRW